jgi:F-type H+-transporting ATPase subunit gamma
MPGIKELKTRIKSIGSTRKITRAMQMVSAAKMKRAQNLALGNRTYAERAWELIQNIANLGAYRHPLIKIYPQGPKIGLIFISTNRGLVGSLNINLLAELKKLETQNASLETMAEIITFGKKGNQMLSRLNRKIMADFPKMDKNISVEEVYPIAQLIGEMYQTGQYRKIYMVYNHFVSTLTQKATVKQILPFKESIRQDLLSEADDVKAEDPDYIFEPDPNEVLKHLLPRILESQILEAILENDASEHSARMVMMKNATEAAGDLISDLTLTFNQLRQNKITTELAEITAGKIALE